MHALITCNCACAVAQAHSLSHARVILFRSGVGTYGPRAECGSSRHFTWPATFYCHPACNLFLFSMIDMQQQTAEIILTLFLKLLPKNGQNIWQRPFFFRFSTRIRPKKGLNFGRRPSFFGPLEWWRSAGTLLGLNLAH